MKPELIGAIIGVLINLALLLAAIEVAKYGWGRKVVTQFKAPWQEELWLKVMPFMKWGGVYLIIQQVFLMSAILMIAFSHG